MMYALFAATASIIIITPAITVDAWTTRVWTVWVHLYSDFFQ